MRCVEVAATVLAEVLCNNGVSIDCDTEVISWPFGTVTPPPNSTDTKKNGKGGKGKGKVVKSGKSGMIFGILVNAIQKDMSKQTQSKDGNDKPTMAVSAQLGPSNAQGTTSHCSEDSKDNNGDEINELVSQSTSTHIGYAVRKVKS